MVTLLLFGAGLSLLIMVMLLAIGLNGQAVMLTESENLKKRIKYLEGK